MRTDGRLFTINFICRNCKNRNVDFKFSVSEVIYQGKHAGVQTTAPAILLSCKCGNEGKFFVI